MFLIAKTCIWQSVYLFPITMLGYLGGKFGILNLIEIWFITSISLFFISSYAYLLQDEIAYGEVNDTFIKLKYLFTWKPKEISFTNITGIDICHFSTYISIGINYEKRKGKIEFISFRVENYSEIKALILLKKIPISISYSNLDLWIPFADMLPHIWWFKKEFMIQRDKNLPITKEELLKIYNSKFEIQFLGINGDYYSENDSTVDVFSFSLNDSSKQKIDLYLEEGYILSYPYQNKFKKALKELALQLNAKIA